MVLAVGLSTAAATIGVLMLFGLNWVGLAAALGSVAGALPVAIRKAAWRVGSLKREIPRADIAQA